MKGKAKFLLIFAFVVVISWGSQTAAEVPSPTVIGPIQENDEPGDPGRDYIFFTPIEDLSAYGYIEEEFFIEGEAGMGKSRLLARGILFWRGWRQEV